MSHKAVTLRSNYWGNVGAVAFSKSGARGEEAVSIQGQKYGKVSTRHSNQSDYSTEVPIIYLRTKSLTLVNLKKEKTDQERKYLNLILIFLLS